VRYAVWLTLLALAGCDAGGALCATCVDAGPSTSPTGQIGTGGGSVSNLYFAVVGDTRPANPDDTANYPKPVIEKIYADIEAMSPRPQFVITTGDYMFASPSSGQAQPQLSLYMEAASQFSGPIFPTMGNHECTGATDSNCATTPTTNSSAFMQTLIAPLGITTPYYTIPIHDTGGTWTAKIVVAACNAWDATQYSWLQGELAKPTTYTFIVRHEPAHTSGPPCVIEMDALLKTTTYDLFIVGHSHTYEHYGKQLTVGNGGAPMTGSGNYGYGTVQQQASGFIVTQYDYMTAAPLGTFTVQ
jgi:hypothetical protein